MAKKIKNIDNHIQNNTINRTITDFFNTDYKDYSKYVIATRALPSVIDGFKVGARKIMHAAINGAAKNGKEIKMLNLVGDVYNLSLFLHGDQSLYGCCFTLAAEFKDNLNPIQITGQHGSLRDEKAVSAPRYLYLKHSKFMNLYRTDEDLLEYVFDEGSYLEPKYYLPIIPTTITARNEGMAPGYKFSSFSYNPVDIIDACIEILNSKDGKIKDTIVRPFVRGINPEKFTYDNEVKRWMNSGTYKVDIKQDILQVLDLPYDIGYDKFEKKLNDMIDKGFIKDWRNYSQDGNINYWVIFNKGDLAKQLQPENKEKLLKKLGLFTYIPDDLLYVLDENGKVKHFPTKELLIEYFVEFRLNKYNDRKDKLVAVMEKKYTDNNNICKFIELVSSGDIVITNRKTKDIKADLSKYELPDSVLTVAISKLTEEEKKEILQKNKEIEKQLKYIKKTSIKDMYLNDLKDLRNDLISEFNL